MPATVDSPVPATTSPSPQGDPSKAGSLLAKLFKLGKIGGVAVSAATHSSDAGDPDEQELVVASHVGFYAGFNQAQEHEGNKVAVIGEEQKRVIRVASSIKGAQIAPVWPKEYDFERPMTELQKRVSIAFNQGWLNGIMAANFDIVDIGRSVNYRDRSVSEFYRAERILLNGNRYPYYRRRTEYDTLNFDYE